ncbi:MAG: hypothetical protein ACK5AZ_02015 [Bryobacteraceae bacterium]
MQDPDSGATIEPMRWFIATCALLWLWKAAEYVRYSLKATKATPPVGFAVDISLPVYATGLLLILAAVRGLRRRWVTR